MIDRCVFYCSYEGSPIGYEYTSLKLGEDEKWYFFDNSRCYERNLIEAEKSRIALIKRGKDLFLVFNQIELFARNTASPKKYISVVFHEKYNPKSFHKTEMLLRWFLCDHDDFCLSFFQLMKISFSKQKSYQIDIAGLKGIIKRENAYSLPMIKKCYKYQNIMPQIDYVHEALCSNKEFENDGLIISVSDSKTCNKSNKKSFFNLVHNKFNETMFLSYNEMIKKCPKHTMK